MPRPHTAQLLEARAECQRCAWKVDGKNAQALAAQHHDKHRHPVRVTTTMEIVYGVSAASTVKKGGQDSFL